MTDRDNWWATHTDDTALTKGAGPQPLGDGFSIDQEAVPAVKAAFVEAIWEMAEAGRSLRKMQLFDRGQVNPVVDRFVAALVKVGFGDDGSVASAADSAITEYQNVVAQLERTTANYQANEDRTVADLRRAGS